AHSRQRFLERLGLLPGPLVGRSSLSPTTLLRDLGAGLPPVLARVLVARPPDPPVQVEDCLLVEWLELSRLRLGDQQPLAVVEHGQEGFVHRVPWSYVGGVRSLAAGCFSASGAACLRGALVLRSSGEG